MNNLSILPVYESKYEQNHRKDYALGEEHYLTCPNDQILPFQYKREYVVITPDPPNPTPPVLQSAKLFNLDDQEVLDITVLLRPEIEKLFFANLLTTYEVIQYTGNATLDLGGLVGAHYLQFTDDGGNTRYTDVFTLVDSVADFLKIEFWAEEDLVNDFSHVSFSNAFKFKAYLPTQLGRPEYVFEEDVTRRDGLIFFEKRVAYKLFKFNFLAPEYLCDALRVARLCDKIEITSKFFKYDTNSFLFTPTWLDGGFLASVDVEFTAATIFKNV